MLWLVKPRVSPSLLLQCVHASCSKPNCRRRPWCIISHLSSFFSLKLNRLLSGLVVHKNLNPIRQFIGRRISTPGSSQRNWKDQNDIDRNDFCQENKPYNNIYLPIFFDSNRCIFLLRTVIISIHAGRTNVVSILVYCGRGVHAVRRMIGTDWKGLGLF
jgi:hypothetical protein